MVPTQCEKQNSLCFSCVIAVFPVYFQNKVTTFQASKIKPSTSHNNFVRCYYLHLDFISLNFQIPSVFPVWIYFSQYSRFPCGVGTLFYGGLW